MENQPVLTEESNAVKITKKIIIILIILFFVFFLLYYGYDFYRKFIGLDNDSSFGDPCIPAPGVECP